ncbi:MAG: hypothetical protein OCC49_17845 [Fibrobacterales bacterium]
MKLLLSLLTCCIVSITVQACLFSSDSKEPNPSIDNETFERILTTCPDTTSNPISSSLSKTSVSTTTQRYTVSIEVIIYDIQGHYIFSSDYTYTEDPYSNQGMYSVQPMFPFGNELDQGFYIIQTNTTVANEVNTNSTCIFYATAQ